ncbi:hypothetical protein F8388_024934 [Cannabis sativa]|uniref:DUF1985 domain-containing protein n=1 Tax=Cannabis sativa TaxID=3483 RepID=A0A7J6GAB6_CANSA|nr:hypothetical protein G4B88_025645 [Cannabis sativa]KAF4379901.1 hypothetical protein F8388_024934 [Cannabis sativa]
MKIHGNMTKVSPLKKERRASSSRKKRRNENEFSLIDRSKGCCFGFLLDMDESLQPAIMIIHSLLLHQRHTDNKTELELNFEDKKATFGLDEFALITGLNCSQLPKHVGDSYQPIMIKEKYFPGKHFVSRDNLKEFMLFGTIKDGDDAIKMAKVFTVTNILESKRGSTAVDEFIMKLVDDKEDFDKYPWGRPEENSLSGHCVKTPTLNKEKDKSVDIPLTMPTEKHTNTSQERSIEEEIFELLKDVKGEMSVVKKDTDEIKNETANVSKQEAHERKEATLDNQGEDMGFRNMDDVVVGPMLNTNPQSCSQEIAEKVNGENEGLDNITDYNILNFKLLSSVEDENEPLCPTMKMLRRKSKRTMKPSSVVCSPFKAFGKNH